MAFTKQTFVFKNVSNLDLQADVYLPNTPPSSDAGYPVVLYMHLGALMVADRTIFSPAFREELIKHNWAVVSFDYRLAPEVKLDQIWSDCEDAYKWVLNDASRLANATLDTSKIALYGLSAGGLLALIGGYKLTPRPKAIMALSATCDLMDPYYTTPKEVSDPAKIVPKSVEESILDHPISQYPVTRDLSAPRARLFSYFVQNGTFTQQITGLDPHKQSDVEKLISWVPARNITADFPPTFIGHGNKDDFVSLSEPTSIVQELKKNGVAHEFVIAEGQPHAYEMVLKPGDEAWDKYIAPTFAFVEKYLQ